MGMLRHHEQLRVLIHADAVVAVSPGEAIQLAALCPECVPSLHVIPNGYDLPQVRPVVTRSHDDARIKLVYTGRFVEHKGLHLVLLAMASTHASNRNFTLTCVGSGHGYPAYEQHLRQIVANGGLSDNVRFKPWDHDSESLAKAMRSADIFISAARYEPFGFTYYDALREGCACAVTRTSGAELIFGSDFPYIDRDNLAPWMAELSDRALALADATTRAYENARTLTVARMRDAYSQLFDDLAQE